jgi:hypothetical protein
MPAIETVDVYLVTDPSVHRVINACDFDPAVYQYESVKEKTITIINPDRRNARLEIPESQYNPDVHELWETHPKFKRR